MDRESEDRVYLEALEALLDHPGWALYEGRLQQVLERARADLESVASWEEYLERRGKLAMLRVIMDLPRRMIKEIRARLSASEIDDSGGY